MEEKHEKVEKPRKEGPPRGAARRPKTCNRYPFELKLKAVKLYLEEGFTHEQVTQELKLGPSTLSMWVKRYRHSGQEGLKDQRPGPPDGAAKLPPVVTGKILELKQQDPSLGVKRISQWLKRVLFLKASPETVRQKLHQAGLLTPPRKPRQRNITRPRFFERATPNQMWQSDIFTFRLGGRYAYVIAFLDDYSRYVVGADLFRSPTAEAVIEVYRQAVAEYKPPKEMLTDNGRQYTSWRGTSRFEAELKKDGVAHFKSRPQHPMTLGKIERFWSTLWQDFLTRAQFESFDSARERIKFWIKHYNHKRPHQGIEGLCPADRFFEIQTELRKTIEAGIKENILEMALRGQPRAPFYMVGRMDGQSVVLRAEKGKLKLELSDHQNTKELVYDLNQPQTEQREDQTTASAAPNTEPHLQRPGESAGGAGGLDGAVQSGGSLPSTADQRHDLSALAATGHGGDVAGAGEPSQPGQRPSVEPAAADAPAKATPGQVGGEDVRPPGTDPKQDCQLPRSGAETSLDERRSQGAGTSEPHSSGPGWPAHGHRSGTEAGCLPQDLLSVGAPGFGRDDGAAFGLAAGASGPAQRPGEGPAAGTTSPGGEGTGRRPASAGAAGDPGQPPENPS
jgi:transposase InsO family protein